MKKSEWHLREAGGTFKHICNGNTRIGESRKIFEQLKTFQFYWKPLICVSKKLSLSSGMNSTTPRDPHLDVSKKLKGENLESAKRNTTPYIQGNPSKIDRLLTGNSTEGISHHNKKTLEWPIQNAGVGKGEWPGNFYPAKLSKMKIKTEFAASRSTSQ